MYSTNNDAEYTPQLEIEVRFKDDAYFASHVDSRQ
jgi:hypothetical protein